MDGDFNDDAFRRSGDYDDNERDPAAAAVEFRHEDVDANGLHSCQLFPSRGRLGRAYCTGKGPE